MADIGNLGNGVDAADFVVGKHHRSQIVFGRIATFNAVRLDLRPLAVDRQDCQFRAASPMQRFLPDREIPRCSAALTIRWLAGAIPNTFRCQVVRFGAAAREDEGLGQGVQQVGNLAARPVDGAGRFGSVRVIDARCVSERHVEPRQHLGDHAGIDARRGMIVEVDRSPLGRR